MKNDSQGIYPQVFPQNLKYFNCALKIDGSVKCWGRYTAGETSHNVIIPSEKVTAVINQDLSLQISKARYTSPTETSILWVDFIFAGENEQGEMFWKFENYGVVE